MGAGGKTSLKDMGRLIMCLFTTARIGSGPFSRFAFAACALKFVLYVVTQTVVLIGTPTYTRLSLDADMLCLAVAVLAMCRARDAGTRGLYGFLGGIAAFYGVGFLLLFGFKATGTVFNVSTVRVISIVPQVTLLIFVWWMSRRPSASSQLGPA
ncbi:hypothetical protein D3273_15275 [Lichenibacterium minor]|uniref:Uncharacterized protein n=1 Tax=Lichenibacterium minor TaxID=2316528 RepID=A0A4Q2U881_9HYPH|nr:hypothetical protein [Lichenibacterium minor]RYC31075.1 hypothetical protein D3273_15275 [Lichenibacterium minor]